MEEKGTKKQNIFVRLWNFFTTGEKIVSGLMILLLIAISVILPFTDEDCNGLGTLVTILVFFEVGIGLLCELLNSKQNKWGCFIYIFVEIITATELLICNERFISVAIALFVWIPVHLITFINWNRHTDEDDKNKTQVRRLKNYQAILMVVFVVAGTLLLGYLSAGLFGDIGDYPTGVAGTMCYYFDASLGLLGICDGLLLLFRFKEAWYVWYVYIIAEIIVNICCQRWPSLVYDLGYLINTTYGLILWNKYINNLENKSNANDSTNVNSSTNINATCEENKSN